MRKVIKSLLQASGIANVHEAPNGSEGIEAICAFKPDVVLLDWDMPDIDGPGFMRIVRSPREFARPNVPVIMLTSHVEREAVIEAVRLGVNELLCKPVTAKALYNRIVAIRERARAPGGDPDPFGPRPRNIASSLDLLVDPADPVWLS